MQKIIKGQECSSYEETKRKASNRENEKLLQTNLRIEYKIIKEDRFSPSYENYYTTYHIKKCTEYINYWMYSNCIRLNR